MELIAGQRADLTGAAAGRRDRAHAEHVAQAKSGRYSVTRPLQLGALAADAPAEAMAALLQYGHHLGRAFALRDDALGVWGDPAITGKPAGDDLLEAKATVVLSIAEGRLTGEDAALLERVGTAGFTRDDVDALAAALRAAGVEDELEGIIADALDAALASLDVPGLDPAGADGLRNTARAIAWREA